MKNGMRMILKGYTGVCSEDEIKRMPKVKKRCAKEIASFLIRNLTRKVRHMITKFKGLGFTSKSLINDLDNLFRLLVLVG